MPALLTKELCTGIIAPTTGQLLTETLRWLLQRPHTVVFWAATAPGSAQRPPKKGAGSSLRCHMQAKCLQPCLPTKVDSLHRLSICHASKTQTTSEEGVLCQDRGDNCVAALSRC